MMVSDNILAGRRILLVDDEKYTLRMVKTVLTYMGAEEVFEATRAEEAVLYLRDGGETIDAMMADFNMPGVNGLLMVKAIRCGRQGIRRDLPVVMLTGHTDSVVVARAKALDINGFISKPVSKVALSQTFSRIFTEPAPIKPIDEYLKVDVRVGVDERTGTVRSTVKPPPLSADPALVAAQPEPAPAVIREVGAAELTPGMVMMRDAIIAEGMSIVAGTVLTEKLVSVVRKLDAIESVGPFLVGPAAA